MKEKVDPYLRPLYDALHDMLPAEQVARRIGSGEIEIAPLAFMRGRTLAHCFVILDEAQNTTPMQMKMFLTRLGEGTRMVVTGDPSQIDLPSGQQSGLTEALRILDGVQGIGVARFDERDVVRHPLVAQIVSAYGRADAQAARAAAGNHAEQQGRRGRRIRMEPGSRRPGAAGNTPPPCRDHGRGHGRPRIAGTGGRCRDGRAGLAPPGAAGRGPGPARRGGRAARERRARQRQRPAGR